MGLQLLIHGDVLGFIRQDFHRAVKVYLNLDLKLS